MPANQGYRLAMLFGDITYLWLPWITLLRIMRRLSILSKRRY
jgi:hypothetical protein